MNKKEYDVIICGAGAAGSMAAIRAGARRKKVLLLERNQALGRKILLTSNGRCNFTNTASIELFFKKIKPRGEFYREAFTQFFNTDLINFFEAYGVKHKVEDNGRVLPVSDDAKAITTALTKAMEQYAVEILYSCRVVKGTKEKQFQVITDNGEIFYAPRIVLTTGGVSYPLTGSSGDGLEIACSFGHTITALSSALAPIVLAEPFCKDLQGLSFSDVTIAFNEGKKRFVSHQGDILFTHFGLSGPVVLDLSAQIGALLENNPVAEIAIDFLPRIKAEIIENKLKDLCHTAAKAQAKTVLEEFLAKRMTGIFLKHLDIAADKQSNQLNKLERIAIIRGLKAFKLKVDKVLGLEAAMVTNGGVSLKEIDPKTMQSKLVPGLYFAGEIIEGYCLSGGYNLQQAFSTGYLAGEQA